MRINNLWRITNNYSDDVWVWVFETDASMYLFPILGQLFKLKAGEVRDTDIPRDKVQIGFREGGTVADAWVAKPTLVETDRDVGLTSKKEIYFPEHGMFDRVEKTKDVQFMTPAKKNNLARQAVIWSLGKIPDVGGLISSVVGIIWQEQKPKVDDLIQQSEERMKSWVRGQINNLKREDLKKLSDGLVNNLDEYFTAKTPEARLFWLRNNISHFNVSMPYFSSKDYTIGTVGIGVEIATMHIALLRERVLFADELGIPEEERADHIKKLESMIDLYKDFVINTAVPKEIAWRKDGIELIDYIGLGGGNKRYTLRDTVARQTFQFSDVIKGNQRNTIDSYVNRNYYLRQAENSYTNSLLTNVSDTASMWALLKIKPDTSPPIPLDRLTWVGPCTGLIYKGGNEHNAAEDKKLNTHGDIQEIIVRAHDRVDYLKIIYTNGKSSAVGNANGGTEYSVKLKAGVYITKIETWWDWELMAIKFHLSDGSASKKIGDVSRQSRYRQTAVLDNHILSGIQTEGSKTTVVANGMSFGFMLRPDFYDVNRMEGNTTLFGRSHFATIQEENCT